MSSLPICKDNSWFLVRRRYEITENHRISLIYRRYTYNQKGAYRQEIKFIPIFKKKHLDCQTCWRTVDFFLQRPNLNLKTFQPFQYLNTDLGVYFNLLNRLKANALAQWLGLSVCLYAWQPVSFPFCICWANIWWSLPIDTCNLHNIVLQMYMQFSMRQNGPKICKSAIYKRTYDRVIFSVLIKNKT